MTPAELLEEAKARFVVLYHNDETQLTRLLRQALGTFGVKAGVTGKADIAFDVAAAFPTVPSRTDFVPDVSVYAALPDHFRDVAIAWDAQGKWHDVEAGADPGTGNPALVLKLRPDSISPMTVEYFMNLRDWPLDVPLPNGVVDTLLEYLVALIDVPNTERERGVAANTGQVVDLPSRSELRDRVAALEVAMEEGAAFISSTAVW